MQKFHNSGTSRLLNNISAASLTLEVSPGTGALFPQLTLPSDFFLATLEDVAGNFEVVKVVSRTGDQMGIVRAQEGTVAMDFAASCIFELRLTAGTLEQFIQKDGDVIDGGVF